MTISKFLSICFGLVLSSQVFALAEPQTSFFDHRIRYTDYRRDDVVQLGTVVGYQTHIEVEEGEKYLTHAFGDSAAYVLAVKENHYFLKPVADNADTNLTIVTDRRVYNFRLRFTADQNAKAIYDLSFRYPDTLAAKAKELAEKSAIEAAFKERRGKANTSYAMAGDLELAPMNVWDDQEFTYFKFPANLDLPGIYLVDSAGNESIANRVSAGQANDIYAVQKVNPKWMLRLGDSALVVFNEAFDPVGVPNTTGTKSPSVKRVVKGAE